MLSAIGLLNSQTAGSPCGCISFNPVGIRGQKVPISTVVGGVTNCTLIRGILVINQPTTWNQLSIRMEAGSGIEVRSSLIIDESNIGTCDTLWSGIYALGGDTCWISVDRSVVSGANIAIELRDEASYAIQRTQFINNFIGISTGNPFTAPASDIEVYAGDYPILGCEFATNGQLPPPYFGHYYYPAWPSNPAIPFNQGYAALYISGSIGLNLGELAPTFPERNRIHHMRNGVIVNNATTRILGSDFYNFVGSVPKFAAYNEELNFNQRAISAAGSTCHIEHDSMYNLMIGIHSTRSSQDIIDNYLNIRVSSPIPATRGVDISQPVRSYVSENDIYNGFMGISVNGSSGSLLIEYNNLFRSLTVENNVGINLQTLFNGLRPNTVQENVLEITGAQKAVGISMNTISDLLVYHNIIDFFDTDLLPAGVENAGISGMQVYNSLISENFVTGTLDYQTELDNSGIIMTNNMANDLNCNTTDSTFYGHWYIGNNMGTDLKSNEFYNAHHGLELFSPTVFMSAEIGTQLHHGNRWLGTYDPFGAFINGPDPENTALNSQFIADESDDDPGVLIPASYGPLPDAVDWFEDVDGVTTGAACNDYGPDPPLTDTLIKLVRNPVEFSDYEDEMNWMRKADMLSFLHLNPDYLANPVLDSFFDAESSTALGELIFGHFQLNKIHGADPVMPEKDSLVFEYMAQVRVLDSLIALNPINISTLKALRVLKIDTLSGHFSDWLGMLESQVADTESEISDAVDLVSNASPTNDQETFLQAILLLKGRRSLGDSITTAELTDVYAHARQCPWLGARSLSEAQGLYSLVADSIFTHRPGACSQLESFLLEDRSDKSDRFYEVMIYPNPTTEVIHLKLPTWVQLIEIFNLDGRQWKQLDTPNGGKFTISVYDLPAGMYTIRAQGEKKIETHQLFITQ